MFVEFRFVNFRSFRDEAVFSMIAASKLHQDPKLDGPNVFVGREKPRLELLRVAALYGANASGKSNVALALGTFLECVRESANVGFQFTGYPFGLDTNSSKEPVSLESTVLWDGVLYRYGFQVKTAANEHEILGEWLYQAKADTEIRLFERYGAQVHRGRQFREGTALLKQNSLQRSDALFLSLLAQLGGRVAAGLVRYLTSHIGVISGLDDEHLRTYTVECLREGRFREQVLRLIREADTGIPDLLVLQRGSDVPGSGLLHDLPEDTPTEARQLLRRHFVVLALHPVYDSSGIQVGDARFPLKSFESQGTQKLFAFAGPILDTLDRGATLFVDEMDTRFHPLLTQALIRAFQSSETNPKNAQLIFVTHDTNLLDARRFRRDQIWFVEKDRFGASHLYSLADFKGVRKDASYEEDYVRGRYGAIPFLGGLNRLFGDRAGDSAGVADDSAGRASATPAEPAHAPA
jgi:hypothetical protein